MKYRLTKIAIPETTSAPSASSIEEYRSNMTRVDGFSPPVEYYVEGQVIDWPEKGGIFRMFRDNRNGVACWGVFVSSPINSVYKGEDFTIFKTENSIYKLEQV